VPTVHSRLVDADPLTRHEAIVPFKSIESWEDVEL
jgi:hypothetical protein